MFWMSKCCWRWWWNNWQLVARPREVPMKKEKVAKGWLSDSLQRHLIVGSGRKNLELQRHLLAFCVFGEAISNFFESFLFVRIASCPWDTDENQWKGNAPVYDIYPNCSDASWRWHMSFMNFQFEAPFLSWSKRVSIAKQTAQRAHRAFNIYFGYLKSNFQRARNSSFESWNCSWNCSLTNPKPASGNMKMAAYTKLIAKHTISSPNKHGVSMCGIFTYHFKNIDGKNVGKSTVPPTGSTTKIPAKKKTYPANHHPPPSIRVCQESVFIYTLEAPYTQGPTSLLVNIGVSWIDPNRLGREVVKRKMVMVKKMEIMVPPKRTPDFFGSSCENHVQLLFANYLFFI